GADAAAELDLLPRRAAVDLPRQHDAEAEVAVHIGALQFGDRAAAVDETAGDRAGPIAVVEFEQRRHVARRLLPRDGEGALHAGPPVVLAAGAGGGREVDLLALVLPHVADVEVAGRRIP